MLGAGVQIVAAHLQANSHITKKNKQQNKETGVEAIGYSRGILPRQVFDLKCYVDASFAADLDTRRSTASMESEYMAATSASQEQAIWLSRLLLEEMGFRSKKPIIPYEDNKAAILFSDHPGDHRRSTHNDTRKYLH